MKNIILVFIVLLISLTGCKKWLDINSDPDTPQQPSNASVLPQLFAAMPTALESDGGLYIAKYIQNWLTHTVSNNNTYDRLGYAWSGGTMAAHWNMVYYTYGKNLEYILENSEKLKQNDFKGVALALKAWAYQESTDYHEYLTCYGAFKETQFKFPYQNQDTIYTFIDSLCQESIKYLNMAIGDPSNTLSRGDMVYNGDILKWKKFAFGILARNKGHLINKSFYDPDLVIKYCDSSLAVVGDDFCVPFDATFNDNSNYFGPYRDNMPSFRQSTFIVRLLDGTILAGESAAIKDPKSIDPRIAHMLSASHDTTNGNGGYRGVEPGLGDPYSALLPPESYLVNGQPPTSGSARTNYLNSRKKVGIAFGDSLYVNPSKGAFSNHGKYLFKNKAVFPIMTAAEIQFIKAEAAFRKGDKALAYTAYKNGIQLHFNFINRDYSGIRTSASLYNINPIAAASITKYMTSKNVSQLSDSLKISDIMLQKYIALWGWGFVETWSDLRKYNYLDPTDLTYQTVYPGFNPPTTFYDLNKSLPAQRVRPHYTSEYTYNIEQIERFGINQTDWHIQKMWFVTP
ncbi:MAG: SusD/RagB family nutrient-binding outer membrane lipoprotein [Niabella sp.]